MPLTDAERAIVEGHLGGVRPRKPEPDPPPTPPVDDATELPPGWTRIPGYPEPLLNGDAAAAELGIKRASLHRYRVAANRAREAAEAAGVELAADVFPEPDFTFGRSQAWMPSTLHRWRESQPGRGAGGGRPRKEQPAEVVQS